MRAISREVISLYPGVQGLIRLRIGPHKWRRACSSLTQRINEGVASGLDRCMLCGYVSMRRLRLLGDGCVRIWPGRFDSCRGWNFR